MQPSSLILLAIVVVWAAYLVPQWVRRRDEMSQSRDGDRFSGGLRVLQRRERTARSGRSGDPLLTSPRVIVDTDGELLYIPADRLLSERLAGSPLSLPQSARPGQTLPGAAATATDGPEQGKAEETPAAAPADEAVGTRPSASESAAAESIATPAAEASPASPSPASADESMAELEAGLLAGFGLTAQAPAPAAEAEAMPRVQAPPEGPSPEQQHSSKEAAPPDSSDDEMAELKAGLLEGFGLTAPPRPTRTSSDYVPGSRPVRKPRNPAPTDRTDTDEEPAWVVEPPAVSPVTVPVTTSAPISASAEAAQESFQELIGRPGGRRAPEVAAPEPESENVAQAEDTSPIEYTTTHTDLDSARLSARVAARRRARSMAVLLIATIAAWVFSVAGLIPVFVPLAATLLLAAHAVASRTAAVRSRESLTMLAAHLYAAEMAREHAEKRRRTAEARTRARAEAEAAVPPPERVARRAAAVSADTWDPIPVPPPTYTLKPAVHRPPPPPLETPAEKPQRKPQAPAASAASDRQVSRGSMPRRAADIERILELDETELPRAVNE